VVKYWIDSHFYDFAEDYNLKEALFDFIDKYMAVTMEASAVRVKNIYERKEVIFVPQFDMKKKKWGFTH